MSYTIQALADKITATGKVLHYTSGSIFEALEVDDTDESFNTICSNLASKLNNELILVKNKLRPFMNDVITYVNGKLEEIQTPSPISGYNIEVFVNNHLLDELYKQKILHPRRDPHYLTIPLSVPCPDDDETLISYFTHPTTSIDMYIEPIRSKLKASGLKEVFEKYFSNLSETNPNIANMGVNTLEKVDETILVYVAANNFVDNIPAGIVGDETVFKTNMANFYAEVCNFLSITKSHIDAIENGRQLVIRINGKTAFVHGELYKEFLDNGGTPDVILGLIATQTENLADYMYDSIIEKQGEYHTAWANFVKVSSFSQMEREVNKYKTLYSIVIKDIYENQIPEDLKEYLEVSYDECVVKFNEVINNAPKDYILDVDIVIRDLVGKILFPNTNFQHFAEHITEYVKLNPTFTPADGATFAAVELIIDFMLEQLYLGGVDGVSKV